MDGRKQIPTTNKTTRPDLNIRHRSIDRLTPYRANARRHSKKQVHQIARSIEHFGFLNPILIDQNGTILAGHGRFEAAKLLGFVSVPTVQIEHLTEADRRAYVLADNKIALNASWDPEILAIELEQLAGMDLNFDLELTGFSTSEIDVLVDHQFAEKADILDAVPPLGTTAVTRIGDLWQLGSHRLVCGNALEPAVYKSLLGDEEVRLVFADPPYNVRIDVFGTPRCIPGSSY